MIMMTVFLPFLQIPIIVLILIMVLAMKILITFIQLMKYNIVLMSEAIQVALQKIVFYVPHANREFK